MSTITEQQKQHLLAVEKRSANVAANLRHDAASLRALSAFPDDMLRSREYPERLRRGIARGAARLENAAKALDAASRGAAAVSAGSIPGAFTRDPIPSGGQMARHGAKEISVKPASVRTELRSFPDRVHESSSRRALITSIQHELKAAGGHRGIDATDNALVDAIGSLRDFEHYLGFLHDHALAMTKAIVDSQKAGHKQIHHTPPLKMRVRRPVIGGGKGAATASSGGIKGVPAGKWPGNGAGRQKIACWLARSAAAAGLPPTLPVVCALVESGLSNVDHGDRDSIGLFQIRVGIHLAPPGFGSASGKRQSADWWNAHPEAQMAWFVREAKSHKPAGVGADAGADGVGRWAVATERPAAEYAGRYRERYAEAAKLVHACADTSSGGGNAHGPVSIPKGSSVNAAALKFAEGELKKGVHEIGGANTGPKVATYLKNAGISGPAPWCAAFVKWCLNQAGFKFPSGNWAWCQTYLDEAAKSHGVLFKVSHSDARPGDLIVFGGHHIAMVESNHGGVIKYVGGNQSDAVTRASISTGDASYTIVRPRVQH